MIPVEIFEDSSRVWNFASEALKMRVGQRFKTKVNQRQFRVSDLVLRKAHPYQLENKLSPKRIGPYRVVEALKNGAYQLKTLDGGPITTYRLVLSTLNYFNCRSCILLNPLYSLSSFIFKWVV